MKLYKALKIKKRLAGEISTIKNQIKDKNSYLVGSLNSERFNINTLFEKLQKKIDKLINLKFAINQANVEIQAKIYILGENKALISFLNEIDVTEGNKIVGYADSNIIEYKVQMSENKRDEHIKEFQKKVDAIQEEIDVYNFTTDIPWDEEVE
jgi:hypothetical protein